MGGYAHSFLCEVRIRKTVYYVHSRSISARASFKSGVSKPARRTRRPALSSPTN